ncbi:MAG: tripartite tricarboxylate transporter substrate binding protein [Negativicutes bacterium]|nr:tripartite tricarboxylate transporter substrate binding protein [Negativicutes bacterium]
MRKTISLVLVLLMLGVILVGCSNFAGKKQAADSTYPNKPITLIVPYSAGGSSDIGARLVAKRLEQELGQPVVVENVVGAAGWVGWQKLAKAKPDGYTLSLFTLAYITSYLNPDNKRDMNLDNVTQLVNHVWDVTAWAVKPDSPFKDARELLAYVKANPGKVTVATSGVYTQHHIAVLALDKLGYKMKPVHTNGLAESLTMALGGHVDVVSMGAGDVRNQVKEGALRALAVLDTKRSRFLPDVPTFAENTGINLNAYAARGYVGPANMDPAAVKRLETAFKKIMEDPQHVAEMEAMGLDVRYMDSKAYKAFLKQEEADQKKALGW